MRDPLLALSAGLLLSAGLWGFQATQSPNQPPPQPVPGAANGPTPGPAVKPPGPGDRTSDTAAPKKPSAQDQSEAARAFLAIGPPPDPEAVKRGQATFVQNCAFCHGSNAHGGNSGPDLVRSVIVLHDAGSGKEIGPVILHGRQAKGMPAFNFSEAQIKDIAAFLQSRHQAAANRMDYKILNIVTGDPKQGEAYFSAHCASCHSGTGDLAHIATKFEPVDLQGRFLYPVTRGQFGMGGGPKDPKSEPTVTVTLASGKKYKGTLDHIDDFSVALTDEAGEHHSWVLEDEKGIQVSVHDPLEAHEELLKQYTDADMHNILAYLETLK
jgi:cytochrome c oxidase cbb3-type subunit III